MCGDLSPQFNGIIFTGTIFIASLIGSVTFAIEKKFPLGYILDPILLFFSTAAVVIMKRSEIKCVVNKSKDSLCWSILQFN
jgi:hypothetical protein